MHEARGTPAHRSKGSQAPFSVRQEGATTALVETKEVEIRAAAMAATGVAGVARVEVTVVSTEAETA